MCKPSHEPVGGLKPNLHGYNIGTLGHWVTVKLNRSNPVCRTTPVFRDLVYIVNDGNLYLLVMQTQFKVLVRYFNVP